jgi:hypothetical protein
MFGNWMISEDVLDLWKRAFPEAKATDPKLIFGNTSHTSFTTIYDGLRHVKVQYHFTEIRMLCWSISNWWINVMITWVVWLLTVITQLIRVLNWAIALSFDRDLCSTFTLLNIWSVWDTMHLFYYIIRHFYCVRNVGMNGSCTRNCRVYPQN